MNQPHDNATPGVQPQDATPRVQASEPDTGFSAWRPQPLEDAVVDAHQPSAPPAPPVIPDLPGVHNTISTPVNFGEINGMKVVNEVQAALEHLRADDAYLQLTLQLFAAPEGFDNAFARWRDNSRILVLAREPGTGRTAIAHALLARMREDSQRQVNVGALKFGGGVTFPIDRLPPKHHWAYLVEVPPDEDGFALHSQFRWTLTELEPKLSRRHSWMIFLLSPDQWNRCVDDTITGMRAEIGDVVPEAIARTALTVREPSLPADRWLKALDEHKLISGQPPAEVLEVVDLICTAHRAEPDQLVDAQPEENEHAAALTEGGDRWFDRRVRTVVAARRNWRKQLLAWHRHTDRTSLHRNFLLAAAALPGAPGAHVYALANELEGKLSGNPQPRLQSLDAPGIIELVDAIEADLAEDDTVAFRHSGWDDAVLHYFWTDRPFSRKDFLAWLATAPLHGSSGTFESLTNTQQQELAARIARFSVHWATRQERPEPLAKLAETWHGTPLWPVFVDALDEAAIRSSTDRYIHGMLLKWAKRKDSLELWRAVAELCGREFGNRHTGKALRRLKHVAAVTDPDIEKAVQRSVLTLWTDATVQETLFTAVIGWCEDPATTSVAYRAFGALAAQTDPDENVPVLLAQRDTTGFTPTLESLATGWRVLLSPPAGGDTEQSVITTVHHWLDTALRRHDLHTDVLALLRRAVDLPEEPGKVSPRDRLRNYVFTWFQGDESARNDIYLALTKLFDADFARRLDPNGPHNETGQVA